MTEAQTWTVIGVLAATLIGTCGLMARFATNLLQQSIGRVLDQLEARFNGLDYRFESLGHRFEAIDQRFEALDHRFEALDHRFVALEARLAERIDALDARIGVRIDALDSRIDVLDRDVQAIANRAFGRASATES